jgi:acyl-CoA synthetase (NDP forming)
VAGTLEAGDPIDLDALFGARTIAVVGASPRSGIAETIAANLRVMGSSSEAWFVNPNYGELYGRPCYASLADLPATPDAVVLAVNPLRATAFTADAAAAGIRIVIIPGGGVVEGGEPAREMQATVRRLAAEHRLTLVGPNCMGFIDYTTNVAAYIGSVNPWQRRGGVAAIAQSGSVTDAFIHAGTRIGYSRIVSCGAEIAIDVCDYLAHAIDDPETHSILLFVEGFKRPERFLALADRAAEVGKPVAIVKVGRSPQAQVAAIAHSGSLAGEERVTDAALRAAGVIRCADLDELLETAELLAGCHRMGRTAGYGRTGVVTVSTGEASLIADMAPETGVELATVPEETRRRIEDVLPTLTYIGNPIDPWGAAEPAAAYGACLSAFADSGAYDVLVAVYDSPYRSLAGEEGSASEVASILVRVTADRPDLLPVFVSLTSGEISPGVAAALETAGVPYLRGAREAFRAIALRAAWDRHRARRVVDGPLRQEWPALADDRTLLLDDPSAAGPTDHDARPPRRALSERESLELLAAAGVPVIAHRAVSDAQAAVEAADALGYPVVVKADAGGLHHKTDVGAIALGLADSEAVRAAFGIVTEAARHAGASVEGALVARSAGPGLELIVGARRDDQYGPAVLVGIGGILAEALDDVAVRLAPVGQDDAHEMLRELRAAPLLTGMRGQPEVDRDALSDLICRLGRLMAERPAIVEIDLNPIIASSDGLVAVDALIVEEEQQ